jgi:hypothetical protein
MTITSLRSTRLVSMRRATAFMTNSTARKINGLLDKPQTLQELIGLTIALMQIGESVCAR